MSAEMPEVRWDGDSHGYIAVRRVDTEGWFLDGQDVPLTDDDVSEWVNLDVVHRVCTSCGRSVEVDLVANGCPLCMGCLETNGYPPPPDTVAAELVARKLPPDAGVDVLLATVRREILVEISRGLADKAAGPHTALGSWGIAADWVRRRIDADE